MTQQNFGLLIAYVLPGFVALWGVSYLSIAVRSWLSPVATAGPTVGGFLFVTLASVSCGLATSTIRWLVLDPIHHATGVRRPNWRFAALHARMGAFELLVESHYRYYQCYGNAMVALAFFFPMWWLDGRPSWVWIVCFGVTEALLFVASRDSLQKYYERSSALLESRSET